MSADLQISHIYDLYQIPQGSRCIRVLNVHAPDEDEADTQPLRCDISVVNLASKPAFTALSYVWGPPGSSRVSIMGIPFPVTSNCYSALWHLRKKLGAFCIWVDALCIDQSNIKEKEQQIPLMGDIYSSAEFVYIWLGEGNAGTERAMAYLSHGGLLEYFTGNSNTIEEKFKRQRVWPVVRSLLRTRWSATRTLMPEYLRLEDIRWYHFVSPFRWRRIASGRVIVSIQDIATLLTCPWTDRIWTYQEVILAARPVLVSGCSHLSWTQFAFAMMFLTVHLPTAFSQKWLEIILSRTHYSAESAINTLTLKVYLESSDNIISTLHFVHEDLLIFSFVMAIIAVFPVIFYVLSVTDREPDSPLVWYILGPVLGFMAFTVFISWCLLFWLPPNPRIPETRFYWLKSFLSRPMHRNLLDTICWRRSQDPRDLCFGVYPMLARIASNFFESEPLPTVDYAATVVDVYTDLSTFFLKTCKNTEILALAAEAKCPEGPSWVPDFTKHSDIRRHRTLIHQREPPYPWVPAVIDFQTIEKPERCVHLEITALPCATVSSVFDFIDTAHLTTEPQQIGRIHNAKSILKIASMIGNQYVLWGAYGAWDARDASKESTFWKSTLNILSLQAANTLRSSSLKKFEQVVVRSAKSE